MPMAGESRMPIVIRTVQVHAGINAYGDHSVGYTSDGPGATMTCWIGTESLPHTHLE